jgi:hypothetical protein
MEGALSLFYNIPSEAWINYRKGALSEGKSKTKAKKWQPTTSPRRLDKKAKRNPTPPT